MEKEGENEKRKENKKKPAWRQRFVTRKKSAIKKIKKLKNLIIFHSTNEINNFNRRRVNKKEKKSKKKKKNCGTSQNIRIVNIFLESLLSASFSSLEVIVHLTSPTPRVTSNTALVSGHAVGASQTLI